MVEKPNACDRAVAICTSFHLSYVDESLGDELFDVVDDLIRPIVVAETEEELAAATEALENTVIVMAALVEGLITHCPKDVVLTDIASQLTGSLS